jgi:hypothetical protein
VIRVRGGKLGKPFDVCKPFRGIIAVALWKCKHNPDLANSIPFGYTKR